MPCNHSLCISSIINFIPISGHCRLKMESCLPISFLNLQTCFHTINKVGREESALSKLTSEEGASIRRQTQRKQARNFHTNVAQQQKRTWNPFQCNAKFEAEFFLWTLQAIWELSVPEKLLLYFTTSRLGIEKIGNNNSFSSWVQYNTWTLKFMQRYPINSILFKRGKLSMHFLGL